MQNEVGLGISICIWKKEGRKEGRQERRKEEKEKRRKEGRREGWREGGRKEGRKKLIYIKHLLYITQWNKSIYLFIQQTSTELLLD